MYSSVTIKSKFIVSEVFKGLIQRLKPPKSSCQSRKQTNPKKAHSHPHPHIYLDQVSK